MTWIIYLVIGLCGLIGQNFLDISGAAGINQHFGTGFAGGGISFVDFNQDGYADLTYGTENGKEVVFYKNFGGIYFERVTFSITDNKHQKQVLWVDIDNDGDLDFFIGNWNAANKLYLNDGNMGFTDISISSGISQLPDDTHGTIFGDLDNDGDLDAYVANHHLYPPALYENNGNLTFTDVFSTSGLSNTQKQNFTAGFFDYDQDGDLDIYTIHDRAFENNLYINNGNLSFSDVSASSCSNVLLDAMGACIADMNNDSKLDIYVPNSTRSLANGNGELGNVLLKNNYPAKFQNISSASNSDYFSWCWGASWADYDNDGWQDVYVSNIASPYQNVLLYNNGNETFTQQSTLNMPGDTDRSFTTCTADFNNDGKMDITVCNEGSTSFKLWYNNSQNSNNQVQVVLKGTSSNSQGVGSWIEVEAGADTYTRFTHAGIGYISQEGYKHHVGIGTHSSITKITVKWPSGILDVINNPPINQCLEIEEGTNNFNVITVPSGNPITTITNPMYSVARNWMELLLASIRLDFARPTVHARNLFHSSVAMFDAWAAYQSISTPFMLGRTHEGYTTPFNGFPLPSNIQSAREETISHAMYNLLKHRFQNSPGGPYMFHHYDNYMTSLGYNINNSSTAYNSGDPAALGNYIAQHIIQFGLQDGSNEQNGYGNLYYQTVNDSLVMNFPGNPLISDLDRWQRLTLDIFIDQSGNQIPTNTPEFLSPEWGNVSPFALQELDKKTFTRNGNNYNIFCDPGAPPYIASSATKAQYQWGFSLVSVWASHLDSNDGTIWDISPASIGNVSSFPTQFSNYPAFYDYINGGDSSSGHPINPVTGSPYSPQFVKRADYARVLAEFWADGPDSETPPGHWFTILHYVSDNPLFQKKYLGTGSVLNDLEWDVKAYFSLGGPMHDAAISAWGIKGWYDYIRPVSSIRAMADLGQSSNSSLPNYHADGIPLVPGYIELINPGDPLAGTLNQHVNKIKLYTWKGPSYISNSQTDEAGADWIRAENWWPYQRPSFVTPPFAGYVSGHSTFSRAAAEVMTLLTGDAYFPGGYGEFLAIQNEFLVFEEGPSTDVKLQWATYRDASDQCSLSRIWGGIHPPADDIPGRIIGEKIGIQGFNIAKHFILGTNCQNTITENSVPIPYNLYKAKSIYSAGTVIQPNVAFEAGTKITLNQGFVVNQGSAFVAKIEGCN